MSKEIRVQVNSTYCHRWQEKIAYLLNDKDVHSSDLSIAMLRLMNKMDRRQLLTIRPAGHPDKLWYGFTLADTSGELLVQTNKVNGNAFVGWLPANESTLLVNPAGSYEMRTQQYSGQGEVIGALTAKAFRWNLYLTRWVELTRKHPNLVNDLQNATTTSLKCWELTSQLAHILEGIEDVQ